MPEELKEDIEWWTLNIVSASAPLNEPVFDYEIFTDASRQDGEQLAEVGGRTDTGARMI